MTERIYNSTKKPFPPREYRYDNLVFKVSNYFSTESKETLKDILERNIKRDAIAKIESEKR